MMMTMLPSCQGGGGDSGAGAGVVPSRGRRRQKAAWAGQGAGAGARAPGRAQTVNPEAQALSRGPAGGAAARQGPNRQPEARPAPGAALLNPKDLDAMVTDVRHGKKAVGAKG